ncbi:MAG: hypothetical protein HQM16_08000 [Deltaproteobacteria bacterium]|nr:hypothetical protein [Deltaproteobacteria bacterium]
MAEISTSHAASPTVEQAKELAGILKKIRESDGDVSAYSSDEAAAARNILMTSYYTSTHFNVGKTAAHAPGATVQRTLFRNPTAVYDTVLRDLESKLDSFLKHAKTSLSAGMECKVSGIRGPEHRNLPYFLETHVPTVWGLKLFITETKGMEMVPVRVDIKMDLASYCPKDEAEYLRYERAVAE